MVPSDIVDEIRHRTNLIDLISQVTRLKRSGSNWMGCCPFHEEKTPSFSVSEEKQLYHCFGCGESGTVFSFMMNYHRLSFPEALESLASKAGIDLGPYKQGQSAQEYQQQKEQKKKMRDLFAYANQCFQKCLAKSPRAAFAREYLEKRGYASDIQKKWGIGFAPAGTKHLYQALVKKGGIEEKHMLTSGLIGRNEKGVYDMYRNRIVFPISDTEGQTIGFGARVLDDSKPKYINSPEHILFNKRRTLFGLWQAKEAIKKQGKAIVVEGYTDVISLHQAGQNNAVASLGTAFTKDHAKVLRKYTDQIVFIFDGDQAGVNAAYKALVPAVSEGLDARVIFLPEGEDPDSVAKDKHKFKSLTQQLVNPKKLLDYYIEKEFLSNQDIRKKSMAIETLVELIKLTSDVYLKEALLNQLVSQTSVEKDIFYGKSSFIKVKKPVTQMQKSLHKNSVQEKFWREESLLLRVLLQVPQSFDRYIKDQAEQYFDQSFQEHILSWLDANRENATAESNLARSIDLWPVKEHIGALSKAFLEDNYDIQEDWEKIWSDCIKKMKTKRIKFLTEQLKSSEGQSTEDIHAIFSEIESLKKTLQTNSKPEGL
ncbi:MAG TPA: DNA primase [Oligoflexia bacterium]|nr:DNA primase [Oligoflexia bacterium]HMR24858.1 DNA primase [Oligoflexia bacterium]